MAENKKLQEAAKEIAEICVKHKVAMAAKMVYSPAGIMPEPVLVDLEKEGDKLKETGLVT